MGVTIYLPDELAKKIDNENKPYAMGSQQHCWFTTAPSECSQTVNSTGSTASGGCS